MATIFNSEAMERGQHQKALRPTCFRRPRPPDVGGTQPPTCSPAHSWTCVFLLKKCVDLLQGPRDPEASLGLGQDQRLLRSQEHGLGWPERPQVRPHLIQIDVIFLQETKGSSPVQKLHGSLLAAFYAKPLCFPLGSVHCAPWPKVLGERPVVVGLAPSGWLTLGWHHGPGSTRQQAKGAKSCCSQQAQALHLW